MSDYDKYSTEWFLDKLDNYIYKTGARPEELMWIISEDLIPVLLRRKGLEQYCQIDVFAKDIHNQLYKNESTLDAFKISKKVVATILNIVCVYTGELKDQVIIVNVGGK